MSSQQNWAEALNINPESLSAWSADAPEGVPLVVWCIEQGHISAEDYLAWAKARFETAVVDSRFFTEGVDPAIIEEARNAGTWSAWQFPISRWDDTVFVASFEVPEERGEFTYVLADPRAMREAWISGLERTGVGAVSDGEEPPALPEFDAPVGLSATPQPFVLNLDGLGSPEPEKPATPVKTPPPAAPPIIEAVDEVIDAPIEEAAPVVAQPTVTPKPVVASKPAASAPTSVGDQEIFHDLFQSLATRYPGAIVLQCVAQTAKLVQWSPKLNVKNTKLSLDLTIPTFLRIVSKTALPYHGFLMDSPAHRDFFAALGYDALPACVTAIPIRGEEDLWGILVAIGTEENQKMDSLNFAQELTERLSNHIAEEAAKAS